MDPYPLKFNPIYKQKVWGGRSLCSLGRTLPGDDSVGIGESWELADLPVTSVSGGGGGAERSVIANGPLRGVTLNDAMKRLGPLLLGDLDLTPAGDFPLLVKFLDARENLSVQVHPSPEYARQHPDAHLKSEAWYIVDADPGSAIYKGVREGVTPAALREALRANDPRAVESMLIRVPVKPGDCHYLPSGTCHALGAGVLVAEVQTPSDTTFRVFDWGRVGRELHIEAALECIHFGPAQVAQFERRSHIAGMFTTISRLVLCEHFRIERVRMAQGYEQEVPYDQPTIWMVLDGAGEVIPGGDAAPTPFGRGETLLVPAGMKEPHVRIAQDTIWLEVTFPSAHPEQIA
jgi:mannose-6-phosphate isomerase